ncbi:MAG: DUF4397 domain-containing protein [Myxococcales bacterium]|nr:DUF4397 domain-containing protein [Myxococcales bacterium]
MKTATFLSVIVASALMLSSCGSDDGVPQFGKASVRALHLSPDAPAVDVFLGETAGAEDLTFGNGSSYVEVSAGSYDVSISPAGQGKGASVLTVKGIPFAEGKSYTAFAFDRLSMLKAGVIEDREDGMNSGSIRVRAIHAAAGVGQVDIWNIPSTGSPSALIEDFEFGAVGPDLDLPAGAYTLGFDVDNDAKPDLIFELPELPSGTRANVFAVSDSQGNVALLAQSQDGSVAKIAPRAKPDPSSIRVLHLGRDVGGVDIWANGAGPAVEGLVFSKSTDYLTLDSGTYTFDVVPAGGVIADSALKIAGLLLGPGVSYTAVAYGDARSGKLSAVLLEEDLSSVPGGQIRVRPIHAAYGVGQVDIWKVNGTPAELYSEVDYGAVGAYALLPADSPIVLGLDVNDDATPDVTFDIPGLPAGTIANLFAVTDKDGNPWILAQLGRNSTTLIPAN